MLEGPKDLTGEAKVGFDAWAAKHYTRPRDGAAAVTEDPTELKRLLDCALEVAHAHTLPQIPRGRPPSERSEYKITMNFGGGRYMGKTLEEAGHTDYEGAGFLRWVAGYGTSAFVWHNTADSILLAQSFERLTKRSVVFQTRSDGSSWTAQWKVGCRPASADPSLPTAPTVDDGERAGDEDSDEDDEEERADDVPDVVRLPQAAPSYRMHQVQLREFEKVRDGVVPNMYGDMKMSDPGFWSQPHIDPVDPSPQVLARAPSAGLWSFEPVRDFYLLRRIYLVCPSKQCGVDQVCPFDGHGCRVTKLLGKNLEPLPPAPAPLSPVPSDLNALSNPRWRPFRCRRRTIVHAPVCCLSTRTRPISSYQHLLEAPRHAILRQVLHVLHRTMSNRRFRD